MTPEQASPYRQLLQDMHAELIARISAQHGGPAGRAPAAADPSERSDDSSAQVATERELESAIGEHEAQELTRVNAALARIDAGTYGECIDCSKNIAAQRLQASPDVSRCIACQEKFEQQQRPA